MFTTKGYAAHSAHEPLKPFSFDRREPTPTDVQIEILFCGVCHSDLHIARNEWGSPRIRACPDTRLSVRHGESVLWRIRGLSFATED
jgi:uncharacterized zinc-type alcohol dehydrogenase-like protein